MSFVSENDQKIQENCDRFNRYKSLLNNTANAVICATQYLVRPTEGFPSHSTTEIRSLWNEWRDQEEVFYLMTRPSSLFTLVRTFPAIPYAGAQPCCFRMWGLLIQVQIDGTHGSTEYLRETVLEIAANKICKSHPATCACHVPNHPWTYPQDIEALAPINAKHNPNCVCGGYQRCKQKDEEMLLEALPAINEWKAKNADAALGSMPPVLQRESSYEYTHQVETCACGVCHKSRVDSGTQAAYEKRTKDAAIASFTSKREDLCMRQERVNYYASNFTDSLKVANTADTAISKASAVCKKECIECPNSYSPTQPLVGIGAALAKADLAIETAKAACGGGADHPDFAKSLFAAMGTPHDSKCPHGLPFYACMPCSH